MTPPYYEYQIHAEFRTLVPATKGQAHDLADQIPEFHLDTQLSVDGTVGTVTAYVLAQSEGSAERIFERELGNALDVVDIEPAEISVSAKAWPMEMPVPGE